MKYLFRVLLALLLGLSSGRAWAQDPRPEYEAAKLAFENGNLASCLSHLAKCQQLFGGSNARMESLKCQVLAQQSDWVNAAIAYSNYDRLLPADKRQGEAYTTMLELKKQIWQGLEDIEQKKKQEQEREIRQDLARAQAEGRAQQEAVAAEVKRLNSANETRLYEAAMSSKDKAMLELYKAQVGKSAKNLGQVETEIDKHNNPNAHLLKAVQADNVKELNYLLGLGGNVKWVNGQGESLLHLAVRHNAPAVFDRLIALKADVEQADASGNTPLIKAIIADRAGFVSRLLDSGANPAQPHARDQHAPFYFAVMRSDYASARALLGKGITPNGLLAHEGAQLTPLYVVARHSHSRTFARFLLEQGAGVDGANADQQTPLMGAVLSQDSLFINLLLNHGAEVNRPGADKLTALHLAVQERSWATARYLIERGGADKKLRNSAGKTPLQLPAAQGTKAQLKMLNRARPLINLASNRQLHERQYLLEHEKNTLRAVVKGHNHTRNMTRLKGVGFLAASASLGLLFLAFPESGFVPIVVGGLGGPGVFVAIAYLTGGSNRKIPEYVSAKKRLKAIAAERKALGN